MKRVRLQHEHVVPDNVPDGVLHAPHPHLLLHAGQVHVPVAKRDYVAPAARSGRHVRRILVCRKVLVVVKVEQEYIFGTVLCILQELAPFLGHLRDAEKRTVVVYAALARQCKNQATQRHKPDQVRQLADMPIVLETLPLHQRDGADNGVEPYPRLHMVNHAVHVQQVAHAQTQERKRAPRVQVCPPGNKEEEHEAQDYPAPCIRLEERLRHHEEQRRRHPGRVHLVTVPMDDACNPLQAIEREHFGVVKNPTPEEPEITPLHLPFFQFVKGGVGIVVVTIAKKRPAPLVFAVVGICGVPEQTVVEILQRLVGTHARHQHNQGGLHDLAGLENAQRKRNRQERHPQEETLLAENDAHDKEQSAKDNPQLPPFAVAKIEQKNRRSSRCGRTLGKGRLQVEIRRKAREQEHGKGNAQFAAHLPQHEVDKHRKRSERGQQFKNKVPAHLWENRVERLQEIGVGPVHEQRMRVKFAPVGPRNHRRHEVIVQGAPMEPANHKANQKESQVQAKRQ